jgi:hypothetical protein
MLLGAPAQMVTFDVIPPSGLGCTGSGDCYDGILPAHLEGLTPPPAGAPGLFVTAFDDEFNQGSGGGTPNPAQDFYKIWEFHVDWAVPANSTLTGPINVSAPEFDENLCGGGPCVPQPAGGELLDHLSFFTMYRPSYRNRGVGQESLLVNNTVDVGANRAGIRWAEIRDPEGTPTLFQSGTHALADTVHRWMGSIAMDKDGNIALGYSASSTSLFPSVRYAGRLAGDPLGTLPQTEVDLVAGAGSQTASFNRWGDYSAMSVDEVDDCTFWYTQEYYANSGSFDFKTRIGSFKFPSCVIGVPTPTPTPTATRTVTPTATPRRSHAHRDRDAHVHADGHGDADRHAHDHCYRAQTAVATRHPRRPGGYADATTVTSLTPTPPPRNPDGTATAAGTTADRHAHGDSTTTPGDSDGNRNAAATGTPPSGTATPVRVELSHGFKQVRDFGVLTAGTAAHTFRIAQQPRSSYEVVVDATTGDVGSGLALQRLASDGVTVLQSSLPVGGVGYSRSLRWMNATASVISDQFIRVVSTSCTVPGCGPEDLYRLRAYDTTGVVSRFNNSATQLTILLLQNPTTNLVAGTVHFWAPNGTLAGSQSFNLPSQGTLVLNTSSVPGVAGLGGTITVSHDGPYGVLVGKAVAVEPATGFTFDTPLSSRPR